MVACHLRFQSPAQLLHACNVRVVIFAKLLNLHTAFSSQSKQALQTECKQQVVNVHCRASRGRLPRSGPVWPGCLSGSFPTRNAPAVSMSSATGPPSESALHPVQSFSFCPWSEKAACDMSIDQSQWSGHRIPRWQELYIFPIRQGHQLLLKHFSIRSGLL
eukprot:COSAG05_NODE_3381_length_2097_cov_1.745746_3_plen_161_part_00